MAVRRGVVWYDAVWRCDMVVRCGVVLWGGVRCGCGVVVRCTVVVRRRGESWCDVVLCDLEWCGGVMYQGGATWW